MAPQGLHPGLDQSTAWHRRAPSHCKLRSCVHSTSMTAQRADSHRIEMDVSIDLQGAGFRFVQNSVKTSLE